MCQHYHPLSSDEAPNGEHGYTRRRLLSAGLTLMSTAVTVPAFLARAGNALADTSMRTASVAGVDTSRVLVVVQLSGGNDGLNTVVPYGDDAYYRARPSLGVPAAEVIPLPGTSGLGLHPNLAPLRDLITGNRAAIIQGVGYPNPNRSHFVSMDIWHTASPQTAGTAGRGWIGSAMDQADQTSGMDVVSLGAEMPLATLGERNMAVAFESPEAFRWTGRDLHDSLDRTYDALNDGDALGPEALRDDPLSFVQRTAMDAQVASDRVRKAVRAEGKTRFPGHRLARQLEQVAKMIAADLPTRVYYVTMGGFDTHAGQQNSHANLMRQFAESIAAFDAALEATGDADRVVTVAFSEFGRRVAQNASGGTDHGCAGPMFAFGKSINPGILGQHPSLDRLDQGDLVHTLDFRHVYADLLGNWLKLDANRALGGRFKPAGVVRG